MPTLYIVATPIGNLGDITQRALQVLADVDCVACEDTRNTLKLLTHFQLKKRLLSHYTYNEESSIRKIIHELEQGLDVALVSDSGTPAISDPGASVVRAAREMGFTVVPVPGPSAWSALVCVSGFPAKGISFEGFLSPKKGRRRNQVRELLETGHGFVLYESPFRVMGLLEDISILSPSRLLCLGREMTKVHEEILFGTAEDVLTELRKRPKILGEFSIVVGPEKIYVKELDDR